MDERKEDEQVERLLDTPRLADALESDRFKQFLDHVPIAIAVSELHPSELITYANLEFERITGCSAAQIEGQSWKTLPGIATPIDNDQRLSAAVEDGEEYLGTFTITCNNEPVQVDAWSNTIEDDDGKPTFRLVALAVVGQSAKEPQDDTVRALREKDGQLLELQHRVKNNLQMITALIRLEARNVTDDETSKQFDRLAGRIAALSLLYGSLSGEGLDDSVDLGVYLGEIASSVMKAHAVEGIRLEMKVDTWPVSVNVAMPTGLVVNELLTNSLKHAFGPDGGTIKLQSLVDQEGCYVTISDDGCGLPEGTVWPKAGKLGAIIVQSLRENSKARLSVESAPGEGMSVRIFFAREAAAPSAE